MEKMFENISTPAPDFVIKNKNMESINIPLDDVIEKAALYLERNDKFPDERGQKANELWASKAIHEVLRQYNPDMFFSSELEKQIKETRQDVLDMME